MKAILGILAIGITTTLILTGTSSAQTIEIDSLPDEAQQKLVLIVQRGTEYLKSQQADDGSFSKELGPGITALAATALMRNGVPVTDESVQSALYFLKAFVRESGGIHVTDSLYRNYETCISILCFAEANVDGKYTEIIQNAEAFVKGLQWGPATETDPDDPSYGGFGYGNHRRPDLSNTAFTIEALRAAGASAHDEAIQRAIIFVSRTQNLQSEHNNTPAADKIGDKGFYYTPADTPGLIDSENSYGSSQAGKTENGGLRSYGSMTYAGLKSMLYAGVSKEDFRVQGAVEWIKRNYTLEINPGMEYAGPRGGLDGLFYYYHTFGKALDALGVDELQDVEGEIHFWRNELISKLAEIQQEDGSWVNESPRWLETDPNLVTSYVLLALSHARLQPQKK